MNDSLTAIYVRVVHSFRKNHSHFRPFFAPSFIQSAIKQGDNGVAQHYNDYNPIKKSRNSLLIIDPQKDFHPGGSLAIATAGKDAAKIAKLIDDHAAEVDDIVVSLDTHQKLHIAHRTFNEKTLATC